MVHRKGHKPATSVKETKEDRKRRRDIREKAKERGKPITLEESRKKAGSPGKGKNGKSEPKKKETIELGKRVTPQTTKEGLKQFGGAVAKVVGVGSLAIPAIGGARAALGVAKIAPRAITIRKAAFSQVRTKLQAQAIAGKFRLEGGKNAAIKNTFRTNPKTTGLTKSFVSKLGLSIPAASVLVGAIGSYPFAGFIKEEALQTLSFAVKSAKDAGDLEGEQEAIDAVNDVLDPSAWDKLIGAIPYANIVKQLSDFFKAAAKKNELDQRSLDRRSAGVESTFEEQRRESDEASTQRKLEQQALDSQYFQLIREGKFEEAEELLQSRLGEE